MTRAASSLLRRGFQSVRERKLLQSRLNQRDGERHQGAQPTECEYPSKRLDTSKDGAIFLQNAVFRSFDRESSAAEPVGDERRHTDSGADRKTSLVGCSVAMRATYSGRDTL
jgi:hypothetical protein